MFKSAAQQAELVRSGELSARELVEASLASIERLNGELNAVVTLSAERALAEADAVGPGDDRPLAGVPILVKDLVAFTEGIRTTWGMAALDDWVPSFDSALVRRLRGAGAIIVGKTNLPELGILPVSEPDRFGPARNPWDTTRTPGGSSGGSAAAVAAGMVPFAHANDGGGSIRIPAVVLRPRRAEALARPHLARPGARRAGLGLRDRGRGHARPARHGPRPRHPGRVRAGRPLLGARSLRPVRGRPRAGAGHAADRVHHRLAQRRSGRSGLRDRRARDGRAARVDGPPGARRWRSRRTRATSRTS